jgi:CRISPR-associated endonuclease/helicase Cas3
MTESTLFDSFFFKASSGFQPYPYQKRLAEQDWPHFLNIPTGLGKTAAVTLAWLWKRGWQIGGQQQKPQPGTPRRLVWCLPMRVLVEQTEEAIKTWLKNLGCFGGPGKKKVSVHLLMGGENDFKGWVEHPEEDAVLVGTQDMLLSRALMRGYGISRYRWPLDFALLNNDAFWVFDEVQLMGPGVATSAQLEAFRQSLGVARPCRSLWVSATLRTDWLATVDLKETLESFKEVTLSEQESILPEVQMRYSAGKQLQKAKTTLDSESAKLGFKTYLNQLASEVLNQHKKETTTLVILNTVSRAQALFQVIKKQSELPLHLVHSRFRATERRELNKRLTENPAQMGRIIIATQAVEAGVDISSTTMFTELAPWSSLVQRFGRCNRNGEDPGACVHWIDINEEKKTHPYSYETLADARKHLVLLQNVSPSSLPSIQEKASWEQVIRQGDFLDLFDTDPDLTGFDVDISPYIRDQDDRDVLFFWRDLETIDPEIQKAPGPNELCRASLRDAKILVDKVKKNPKNNKVYSWDFLNRRWVPFRDLLRPGLTLMLDFNSGGYDHELGFFPKAKNAVQPVPKSSSKGVPESDEDDRLTTLGNPVLLKTHLGNVEAAAAALCRNLLSPAGELNAVTTAARWHDVGKAHPAFQGMIRNAFGDDSSPSSNLGCLWAKSPRQEGRPRYVFKDGDQKVERKHLRHELASMLSWIQNTDPTQEPEQDLIAYLILAHHGKLRMRLRSFPGEIEPQDGRLFCRGIWNGDSLPSVTLSHQVKLPITDLQLDLMQLGSNSFGPSWTARTASLLSAYGPFRLAWMETLVRLADWRASRLEQQEKQENREVTA